MNEDEKMIWTLAYMAATIRGGSCNPEVRATNAVIHFRQADERFSTRFETPPEKYDEAELPDFPY